MNSIFKQIDEDNNALASVLSAVYDHKSLLLFYAIAVANISDPKADRSLPLAEATQRRDINITHESDS